jgi:hypothetical protein
MVRAEDVRVAAGERLRSGALQRDIETSFAAARVNLRWPKPVVPSAMQRLVPASQYWPGNVRKWVGPILRL